ncbi:sigma-54 dependent transcriptional regulator [soil metagenome]
MSFRILLVDDDAENLVLNRRLLTGAGYKVAVAESGASAIEIFSKARNDFALIMMDHHMPGMSGDEAVRRIKQIDPNQQIVTFSLDDSREVMKTSFKAGSIDFLDKNSDNETLLASIEGYCANYEKYLRTIRTDTVSGDERAKTIRETGMIGKSESLFELCKRIQRVAPTSASVLILGESGTGKELVAQAIHKHSQRNQGAFVAVNIAAESSTLLDSILFGHKRGAFTGALADHPGKFKQADGGTLFLDEIGDMSLDLQVKLLRVLQEKVITPVGGTREMPIDVRIVAATHKNLEKLVELGLFREDLYYRINTMLMRTAPLRERTEDIEPLVAEFSDQVCSQNKFRKLLNRSCLDVFEKLPWRGNVRELRSVVENILVNAEVREIGAEHLESFNLHGISTAIKAPTTLEEIDDHIQNLKRDLIKKTLLKSQSKAEAARTLKVAPNRLHYFLDKWGLTDLI